MATFCSIQDVRLALAPISEWEDDSSAAQLPDDQLNDAILEAEGVISTYLANRYSIVPVETTEVIQPVTDPPVERDIMIAPDPIRRWTRDIALYLATLTNRKGKDLGPDDPIRLRFNMVMGFLISVRDGKLSLPLPGVNDDAVEGGVTVVNLYDGTLFGLDSVGLQVGSADAQRLQPYRNAF